MPDTLNSEQQLVEWGIAGKVIEAQRTQRTQRT
jgi:hypothetical protein